MMKINVHMDSILQTSLERLAEAGVSEAQYRLGRQYLEGEVLPKDQAIAFDWMLKAAEQDHPRAQLDVALCLTRGVGVPIDMPRAVAYYERAAKHDVMEAAWRLGDILLDGRGVMKDPVRARSLYVQACKAEDKEARRLYDGEVICPEAEWSLGVMLEDGTGGERNVDEAKSHYARVTGVESVEERDLAALELRYAKLLDKGPYDFDSYARAAQLGSIEAMRTYVIRTQEHYISSGRDDDDTFSPKLFKASLDKLVEIRDPEGCLIAVSKAAAGKLYSRPEYSMSSQDFYRIIRFLICTGDVRACNALATAYSTGSVLTKSVVNEFRSYRIAHRLKTGEKPKVGSRQFSDRITKLMAQVEGGDTESYRQLWDVISSGTEVCVPSDVVSVWRKKAVAKGVPRAVEDQWRVDVEGANKAFEEKLPCIMRSSRFEAELTWKVVGDMRHVCMWPDLYACASHAAELGNTTAMVWTARMLVKGTPDARGNYGPVKNGIPKDLALAKQWFEKAALQKELSAEDKYIFAECLFGCAPADAKKITQLYEESASCGCEEAQLALARRLISGEGCNVDVARAKTLLVNAEGVEAASVLALVFNKENNVQEELNCYERMVGCCKDVIGEECRLRSERDKLWSDSRARWDYVYGEDLKTAAKRREIIRKAAETIIRLYSEGVATADQMRKAWRCLSRDSVTFPASGKGTSTNSPNDGERSDEIYF